MLLPELIIKIEYGGLNGIRSDYIAYDDSGFLVSISVAEQSACRLDCIGDDGPLV